MAKPVSLCLSSGKGGVGKSSLAVNLAFALAKRQPRVLVVDGDLGLANVDVLLGLSVHKTLRDILERGGDPREAIIYLEPNLGILPASSGVPEMVNLGPEDQAQLRKILTAIAKHFDFVLVDTAAGLGPSVLWFNAFVDRNILVLAPDPTSLTDAYALIKVMSQKYHRTDFQILINFAQDEREARQVFATLANVASKFLQLDLHYLGTVPRDAAVSQAVREQVPFIKLAPTSRASQAILKVANRIQHSAAGRPDYKLQSKPVPLSG